ncbi:MAG: ABC transporter ATP-binding protein [Acidimicrobiia bacterium]
MDSAPTNPSCSPALLCSGLYKSFGSTVALEGLNLEVAPGELLVLFGPSGCGKTTALRAIAGIEPPDAGEIWIGGRKVSGDTWVPPEERRVGMVFQDWALFPHLNVEENVAFGAKGSKRKKRARVAEVLELVHLGGYEKRMPHELSGGQQQRVALARALASDPQIILLDEPFSNLDASLRAELRTEVRDVLYKAGITAVFVTHDREEALSIADRIAVMVNGKVIQAGTPYELYSEPPNALVARMLGDANVFLVEVRDGLAHTPFGEIPSYKRDGVALLLVRPESIDVKPDPEGDATVERIEFYGHDQLLRLSLSNGTTLEARTIGGRPVASVGARVRTALLEEPRFLG